MPRLGNFFFRGMTFRPELCNKNKLKQTASSNFVESPQKNKFKLLNWIYKVGTQLKLILFPHRFLLNKTVNHASVVVVQSRFVFLLPSYYI